MLVVSADDELSRHPPRDSYMAAEGAVTGGTCAEGGPFFFLSLRRKELCLLCRLVLLSHWEAAPTCSLGQEGVYHDEALGRDCREPFFLDGEPARSAFF